MKFYQDPPIIDNQYKDDKLLGVYLSTILPDSIKQNILLELASFGHTVMNTVLQYGQEAMDHEPILENFDPWGKRIDEVKVAAGWNKLKDLSAKEGLIELGYSREYGEFSRIYQMAKIMLFTPSSAIYTCPLAMTDGAARLIEVLAPDILANPFTHIISRDPSKFWVAGQWMTEREGGSDVSMSSTIARKEGNVYKLYGDKWFTSAIDAEMAMMLARIEENGSVTDGSRGLSLFYLRIRDDMGNLNNIRLHKLKDKLGPRALPTAELTLDGSEATLIGEPGKGVKQIAIILNITRIYNAISSIAYMQRGLSLAKNYAGKRVAFGQTLNNLPLHKETIANLEVEYWGSFLLTFHTVHLLGKVECKTATHDEEAILRLLTPLAKLYTGKQAIAIMSEIVEAFGGIGYIEESGIPALFRDAQVLPIWEGTTNVLSLDVLRAMVKEDSLRPLLIKIEKFTNSVSEFNKEYLQNGLTQLKAYVNLMQELDRNFSEQGARQFSYSLAYLFIGYLLLDFHNMTNDQNLKAKIFTIYKRWTKNHVITFIDDTTRESENDVILAS